MTQGSVLIVGMGILGGQLARRLIADGRSVTGLKKTPGGAPFPGGVARVTADVRDPAALEILDRRSFSDVIFCVAPDESTEEAYRQTYVYGLKNLLLALNSEHLRRVIFTSSTGVYAQDDGAWVDEGTAAEAQHFSGRLMLEAEECLQSSGVPHVIIRLGGLYGPGRSGIVDRLRQGSESLSLGPARYLNLIHTDDAVGAIVHLLQVQEPQPLYLGVDGVAAGKNEVLLWLAEYLQLPPPPVAMTPPLLSHRGNKRCSNRLLLQAGYKFQYPDFRDGFASFVVAGSSEPS